MSPIPFGERLMAAVRAKNSVLCVGLDPRFASLPKSLREKHLAPLAPLDPLDQHGPTPAAYAAACLEFCKDIASATHAFAACVKPNSAFFEAFGWQGAKAWEELLAHCRALDLLVVADIKRGDIGPTAEAYAQAHLTGRADPAQSVALTVADAVTLNPYLGLDTLAPWLAACETTGAGAFVLVKTSNPGSGDFQDLALHGAVAENLHQRVAARLAECARAPGLLPPGAAWSSLGAVVGATYPAELKDLRARLPQMPLLVPGYGAQGGGAAAVAAAFDANGLGAVVNSSRAICFAWQAQGLGENDYARAAAQAAQAARDDLNTVRG